MARSWKALPLLGSETMALKARTYKEHVRQAQPGWKPPRAAAEEIMLAEALTAAIEDEGLRIPQGREYRLWRWPQGLAVGLPSGYILYVRMEGQVSGRNGFKVYPEARTFEDQTQ